MSIHVEQDGECAVCIQQVTPGLRFVRVSWPCDAAAARALADELAESLPLTSMALHATANHPYESWHSCPLTSCSRARAALAKWEASK